MKNPIHILNSHSSSINFLTFLNDGRLVSCSNDNSIIIYNKITYQPDLIIKEHKNSVCCVIQLNSGELASCSYDKTIKLYNIQGNEYENIQTLNYHKEGVNNIVELNNKYLCSCSFDSSIIFYLKDNSEYKKDYQISTNVINNYIYSITQTKDDEICYSELNNNSICFFDLNERKIKSTLYKINKYNNWLGRSIMISKIF